MKDSWLRKRAILKYLAAGDFVSGEWLATELGVSRAAVSKNIAGLEQYGVEIYSVKGRGYKLASPLSLIDEERLIAGIDNRSFYFDDLDSTNAFMLKHAGELTSGDICVAEYQSAGRGRRGRRWQSPYGSHLYCSMYWCFPQGMAQAMGLSLVVACSLATVLENNGVTEVGLKWPNDIYYQHKKLAGVLIEMSGQADSECNLVIGIGMNLAMPSQQAEHINQPWSDLSESGIELDKTELVIALQKQLQLDIRLFEQQGLSAFMVRWQASDIFYGQPIQLILGDKVIKGLCRGIDSAGAVILENDDGMQTFVGGEISLRGMS